MKDAAPSPPRGPLLIVLTRDFGELGCGLYFVGGLPAETGGVLMLPLGLPEQAPAPPGFRWQRYGSCADIEAAAHALQPQQVVFFSAYLLLGTAPGLGLLGIRRLMSRLRAGGAAVSTTDPFLGLLRHPWSLRMREVVSAHLGQHARWRASVTSGLIAMRLWALVHVMRPCLHLYPADITASQPRHGHRWRHFSAAVPPLLHDETAAVDAGAGAPPRWIFVMSRVDHDLLYARQGDGLHAEVARRVAQAVACGAAVQLLAPAPLLQAVRQRLTPAQAQACKCVEALPFAGYLHALRAARYAFFWNRYSFSLLYRVLDGRPVVFLAPGHVEQLIAGFAEAGPTCFYAGWTPPLFDAATPFSDAALAAHAARDAPHLAQAARALRAGSAPAVALGMAPGLSG